MDQPTSSTPLARKLTLADIADVRAYERERADFRAHVMEITAAVHYIRFEFTPEQIEAFAAGPVRIDIEHPDYLESVELNASTHGELLGDLRG